MNQRHQQKRPEYKPLWKRILDQRSRRRYWMRARVPLVLFRFWAERSLPGARTSLQSHVVRYPLNLQVQLSCPSLFKAQNSDRTLQQFNLLQHYFQRPASLQSNTQTTSVINSSATVVHEHLRATPGFVGDRGISRVQLQPARGLSPEPKRERQLPVETLESRTTRILSLWPTGVIGDREPAARSAGELKDAPRNGDTRTGEGQGILNNAFRKHRQITICASEKRSGLPLTTFASTMRRTLEHEIFRRHALSSVLRGNTQETNQVLPVKAHPMVLTRTFGNVEASLDQPAPRLYALPASRTFVSEPAHSEDKRMRSKEQPSPASQPASPPPQPSLDIARLSEEVYRHIQRKIRIERERRGL
jgi:hypothetical protein